MKVLVTQWCPTLCDPIDYSPPGSSVHGILQARILEWLPFLSLGDLPDPRIQPRSPALQADTLPLSHQGSPIKLIDCYRYSQACHTHIRALYLSIDQMKATYPSTHLPQLLLLFSPNVQWIYSKMVWNLSPLNMSSYSLLMWIYFQMTAIWDPFIYVFRLLCLSITLWSIHLDKANPSQVCLNNQIQF